MIATQRFLPNAPVLLRTLALVLAISMSLGPARAQDHEEGEEKEDHGHEAGGQVELDPETLKQLGVSMETVGSKEPTL